MKIYRIWCEWDMGFSKSYSTREKAQQAIDKIDWEDEGLGTLEEIIEDGMVYIEEEEVE
jgi:hypothetical protein